MRKRRAAVLLTVLCACAAPPLPAADARRQSFDAGWRFLRGDAPHAEQPAFDDSHWRELRLPHDWAIEGPFDPALNPHTGALPVAGIGWYRKTFRIPGAAAARHYAIDFDGTMSDSEVWINGHDLGGRPYGYIGYAFDLTPFLRHDGGRNVLAVRLAPQPEASRWYPGAGIYRNVWLDVTGDVSVARYGTTITTPAIAADAATVAVHTQVQNRGAAPDAVTLRTLVRDAGGRTVAQQDAAVRIGADEESAADTRLEIPAPQRWDVDHPYLYSLVTEIRRGSTVLDRETQPFGIRSIVFDRDRGLILNGRHLKLHGVCLHHDLGALGAAVSRRATERQLQILRAAGVNALRTSHNPPSPELLEFADRMGFLVVDEAFDMWHTPKVANGYSRHFDAWSERDLRDLIRRDRNHPSVFLWSIGNEVPEQGEPGGGAIARRLVRISHEEDPTRPTTAAFNDVDGAIGNGLAAAVDIPGFNYQPLRYEQIRAAHPDWIIYGSETASCVSSRGTYHLPLVKYEKDPSLQLSSYDIIAPYWAYCPDVEFAAQDADPALLGEFVWTGFDYLGEPTPYFGWSGDNSHDWPARSSYFGMVDLAGFPKDRYYLYQSVWTTQPMVHLLPHWTWPGHEGEEIPVMVYTNAAEAELWLNGRSLGRKRARSEPVTLPAGPDVSATGSIDSRYRLLWRVPYEPGTLQVRAYTDGIEVARDGVATAGPAARIRVVADRREIAADGDDLAFLTVRIEDRAGNLCPEADNRVRFSVAGAGHLEAVDSGNPATTEPFHADRRKAFNGLALLVVRSTAGAAGAIEVTATSPGLAPARMRLQARRLTAAAAR
jgi:beta-galactosidase